MNLNTVEIAQFRKDPTILSFKLRTDQSLAVIIEKINKATKLSLIFRLGTPERMVKASVLMDPSFN